MIPLLVALVVAVFLFGVQIGILIARAQDPCWRVYIAGKEVGKKFK